MSRAIVQNTAIRVNLAVTVQVKTHTHSEALLTYPLVSLTAWVMLWWRARLALNRARYELAMLRQDVTAALDFTFKVAAIGVKALAFGLGVNQ